MVGRSTLIAGDETVQLPAPPGFDQQRDLEASTISDDGTTIAGQAAPMNTGTRPTAVVWTCMRRS